MPHEELKPKDKVVLKMTRDGAAEENLTQGTEERVSKRLKDPELVKPTRDAADTAKQNLPAEAAAMQEFPLHESISPVSSLTDTGACKASGFGRIAADTIVTHKLRTTKAVRNTDAEKVISRAAKTAEEKPAADASLAPTRKLERLERKSEKTHKRLDAAREKLPTKKVLKMERVFDEERGKGKTRLFFEDEIKQPKTKGKLRFEAEKRLRKAGDTLVSGIHGKIHEVERENAGVEAAHRTEIAVESAVRHYRHHKQKAANKPFEKVSKLEHQANKSDKKLIFEKTKQEHPEIKSQRSMNRYYQKQAIRKDYAEARKAGMQTAGSATKKTGKKAREKAADKAKEFIRKNKKVFIWIGVGLAVIILLAAGISSCTAIFSQTGTTVIASSYLSEDEAIRGAEQQYSEMETKLKKDLDNFETLHPDYDEYRYDLDDIGHDPYVLISILSALHDGEFTLADVQSTLEMLFEKQYILTLTEETEIRYRTETRTGSYTDAEGNTHIYTYTVQVPYNYNILNVELENFNLSHVPVYIMSQDELSMYAMYMSSLGNREDLFPYSGYVNKYITNPPDEYEVPAEHLNDETFATLITEAEKYLNYPYVWGGSNPDTSFDCSGFVSWVLTNSGLVNTGRLGAQGLYNVCTPVSSAEARPGDLVFFVGTYDTPGVSHVGIYVGDQVMLHCGDPIQYTSISSSYWQSHFYAFGRPAY